MSLMVNNRIQCQYEKLVENIYNKKVYKDS